MQSRRRFFCARVELVQLARAFLLSIAATQPGKDTGKPRHSSTAPAGSCTTGHATAAHRATNAARGTPTIATPPGRCTGRTKPPQRARATAPEKGNRRKGHLQPHRATPRRRGYSYTIPGIKAATEPHSGAQRATPPGVQSRPERRRPCPGLLYHAKALIGQPDSVQIFVPFSAIFPGSVQLPGRVS